MNKLLIKNAKCIISVDDEDRLFYDADMLIENGAIKEIGQSLDAENADVYDAAGCFVYPGLINTHHHLYQTFTRNLPEVQRMELFPWLVYLYEIWKGLTPDTVYYSSLTGLSEILRYGCTTCMDHHYVFPRGMEADLIGEQFRAADELGMRFHATRGSMSRGKSDGGLPPDSLVQDVDAILKDSERVVREYHDTSRFSFHQVSLAPCSPFSVTTDLLKESAVLARSLGVRLHTHLCETIDEENFCREMVGMRPLAYMESCGWIGPDVWYAHGIHFNDEELKILADTGTGVAHCPVSNMKLSSGVCRIPEMLKLGINVGLAVDGSASNDCSNLMAEIRAAYLLHRLTSSEKAPTGYDILKMATRGSAAVLGRDDIGYLAPGMAADFFLIDTRSMDLVGACEDPGSLFGTVGYCRPAKAVFAGGKQLTEDGRILAVDEEKLREEACAEFRKLMDRR